MRDELPQLVARSRALGVRGATEEPRREPRGPHAAAAREGAAKALWAAAKERVRVLSALILTQSGVIANITLVRERASE